MNVRTFHPQATLGIALIVLCLCRGSIFAQQAGESGTVEYSTFTILITDPEGKPIPNASVYRRFGVRRGRMLSELGHTDENGIVELRQERVFTSDLEDSRGVMLYALANEKLAGFLTIQTEDTERPLEFRLHPVCKVQGHIESSALKKLNRVLEWTNVYLYRDSYRPLSFMPETGRFECLLPPGWYRIHAYGTGTYTVKREFEIEIGQKELTIDLDLPADTLATLVGRPAPELRNIKGWMNTGPVTLRDLRGKVILLDFWGIWCGPCITGMPELVELHETYRDQGLVVLAVHDDSLESIEELNEKIGALSRERWEGRGLPFPIALDGGGETEIAGTDRSAKGATTAAYGIQSWPTCVLIDREGNVVKKVHPGSSGFLDELEEVLGIERADSSGVTREESLDILMRLGMKAYAYAHNHRGKFPESVARVRDFVNQKNWPWLDENVVYLGKGMTKSDRENQILAYDKSLLEDSKSYGTNVLFTNTLVQFKDRGWLKKQGIESTVETSTQQENDGREN